MIFKSLSFGQTIRNANFANIAKFNMWIAQATVAYWFLNREYADIYVHYRPGKIVMSPSVVIQVNNSWFETKSRQLCLKCNSMRPSVCYMSTYYLLNEKIYWFDRMQLCIRNTFYNNVGCAKVSRCRDLLILVYSSLPYKHSPQVQVKPWKYMTLRKEYKTQNTS